jgi:hypothetical protein
LSGALDSGSSLPGATSASVTEASIRLSWSGEWHCRAGPQSGDVPAGAALNELRGAFRGASEVNWPLAWVVGRDAPPPGNEVAHFLVPMGASLGRRPYHLQQSAAFCSTGCVHRWLERTGNSLGSVLGLGRFVTACTALVRRLARAWLPPPRAQPSSRLLPRRGAARAVLGIRLSRVSWMTADGVASAALAFLLLGGI